MKAMFISILALLAVYYSYCQPNELPIDAAHSVVSFRVGFAGDVTSIEGRFDKFEGEVGYRNPNDRSSFFANITIDVSSLNTGDKERDGDLMGEEYFNVATYPSITFKSSSTVQTANGFAIKGEFEMLGVKKSLDIPFKFSHEDPIAWVFGEPRIGTKGNINLSRREFSIPKRGWNTMIPTLGSMMLNDQVEIRLVIQGVGEGLPAIITRVVSENGAQAAIEKYQQMKKDGEGKGGYEFGAPTLARIGVALSKEGKIEAGLEIAEFATKEEPDNFFGYYALGNIYMTSGDKKKAEKNLKKVLELNPKLEQAKQLLDELETN